MFVYEEKVISFSGKVEHTRVILVSVFVEWIKEEESLSFMNV